MFEVTSNDGENLGKFRSVKAAVNAVEQYYQCGVGETLKEVRNSLKLRGECLVFHCLSPINNCIIRET